MSPTKVVVAGDSGGFAFFIVPALVKSGFSVTFLSRKTSSASFLRQAKRVKTDFSPDSLQRALSGQDVVVSAMTPDAPDKEQQLAEAALAVGVKLFLPNQHNWNSTDDAVLAAAPFLQAKKNALDWLKSNQEQMSWTALITGPLLGWALDMATAGLDRRRREVRLFDGGNARFTTSTHDQIARALVAVLKNPGETTNKLVFTESFTTTQAEVIAIIENLTGEKYRIISVSSQTWRERAFAERQEDVKGGDALLRMALMFGEDSLGDHSHVEGGMWNARLGLENEDLEEEVELNMDI